MFSARLNLLRPNIQSIFFLQTQVQKARNFALGTSTLKETMKKQIWKFYSVCKEVCNYHHIPPVSLDNRNVVAVQTHKPFNLTQNFAFLEAIVRLTFVYMYLDF